jgi:hypothetical protein
LDAQLNARGKTKGAVAAPTIADASTPPPATPPPAFGGVRDNINVLERGDGKGGETKAAANAAASASTAASTSASAFALESMTPIQLTAHLKAFYQVVNASKIPTIPNILAKFKGNEPKLFESLATKYPAQAHLLGGGGGAAGTAGASPAAVKPPAAGAGGAAVVGGAGGKTLTKSQQILEWTKNQLAGSPIYAAKGVNITNWHTSWKGKRT